jgi:hypothetical protein
MSNQVRHFGVVEFFLLLLVTREKLCPTMLLFLVAASPGHIDLPLVRWSEPPQGAGLTAWSLGTPGLFWGRVGGMARLSHHRFPSRAALFVTRTSSPRITFLLPSCRS